VAALEIAEVAGGIWSVRRGPRFRPAFIVKMSPGAVLIDTGSEASGASVMQAFQKARVGLRSVRAILLTSAEPDAVAAAPTLRERCGAPVLASAGAAEKLRPFTLDGTLLAGQIVEERFEVVAAESADALAYRFLPTGALFSGGAFLLSGDRTSSRHR
jgi:glyoxylase-like metal-dependent hydrolase (beta-lactamase superfamily II)